jgi:hypothetical protein
VRGGLIVTLAGALALILLLAASVILDRVQLADELVDAPLVAHEHAQDVVEGRQVGARDESVTAGLETAPDVLVDAGLIVVEHDRDVRALGDRLQPPAHLVTIDAGAQTRRGEEDVVDRVARLGQALRSGIHGDDVEADVG